ncbi:D-beta-hydroxybutyrate dehydrogenase-like protein [Dinothrombium tinctorium]|uniref:D-beta-hydroxybutyrate dehydrogenase-like protein n=1 Tax=Dinothrombium tinctorium TaxID=1965070 RepID=A0A443QLR6_9ACAR|nr:D-beta-hydroxybutyrate dehydrogenase-like protein [Dinothrombium tinctorium]
MNLKVKTFFGFLIAILSLLFASDYFYTKFAFFANLFFAAFASWQLASFVCYRFIVPTCLPKIDAKNKIVLVTGCDSGFGYLTAKALNKNGFKVVAGCLFPDGEGAQRLKVEVENVNEFEIVALNVTSDEHIDDAYRQIDHLIANGYELWGIVNNAGIGKLGEIEWGTFDEMYENIFKVNINGVVKVTRKFLPLLRKSKGRIINVASMVGRFASPGMVPYCMSKHAVVAFSDGLRREMAKFDVDVINIEPSCYRTNITQITIDQQMKIWRNTPENVRNDYGNQYNEKMFTFWSTLSRTICRNRPEDVADAIFESLTTAIPEPKFVCCSTIERPIIALAHWLPLELIDSFFQIALRSLETTALKTKAN